MKIIITGATGFVGAAAALSLNQQGHQVYVIVRPNSDTSSLPQEIIRFIDNGDTEKLNNFFSDVEADGVMHFASLVLNDHKSDDIEKLVVSNVLYGTRLLEASVKSNTKWFINTGTFWQHYDNEKYNPVNLYAATKEAFENIAKFYYETEKINFVTIELNDTFGSNDTRSKIFNLWRKAEKSKETLGMTKGEQTVDISYIENIIDAYLQMMDNLESDSSYSYAGKKFCVSADERMTLQELAKLYEKALDTKLDIVWGERPYRNREVMLPWNKGTVVPGWKQKITLYDAIQKVIKEEV